MKEALKRQERRLYVVTAPHFADEAFDFSRNSLDQSFQGWLGSVEATEEQKMSAAAVFTKSCNEVNRASVLPQKRSLQLCPPVVALAPEQNEKAVLFPTRLTTQDYVQVMLATIREGANHARWPRDVVEHFITAEVIVNSGQ